MSDVLQSFETLAYNTAITQPQQENTKGRLYRRRHMAREGNPRKKKLDNHDSQFYQYSIYCVLRIKFIILKMNDA